MAADLAVKGGDAPKVEDDWDEDQLQAALERLQEMHLNLRQLRDAIPSIVRPIHAEYSSPEVLYADFKTAAVDAVGEVRHFKALMRDSKSKEVFERAKESKSRDGEGIETWLVEQHANWLDEPAVRSAIELKTEEDLELPAPPEPAPKERAPIDQIVKAFKERHPEITVNLQEAISNILFTLPSPAKLGFSISWNPNSPSNKNFEVTTKGPSKLHTSINQGLARRAKKDDLYWTLEMLAEYINAKQQRCDKCNQLLDEDGNFVGVREGKLSNPSDPSSTIQWEAFHIGCANKETP